MRFWLFYVLDSSIYICICPFTREGLAFPTAKTKIRSYKLGVELHLIFFNFQLVFHETSQIDIYISYRFFQIQNSDFIDWGKRFDFSAVIFFVKNYVKIWKCICLKLKKKKKDHKSYHLFAITEEDVKAYANFVIFYEIGSLKIWAAQL